jgi:hypothetical protein
MIYSPPLADQYSSRIDPIVPASARGLAIANLLGDPSQLSTARKGKSAELSDLKAVRDATK